MDVDKISIQNWKPKPDDYPYTGKAFTGSTDVADQFGFIKKEQFIFDKDVLLDEIDALIEIKKPILSFNDLKEEIIKIGRNDIRNYLSNIME